MQNQSTYSQNKALKNSNVFLYNVLSNQPIIINNLLGIIILSLLSILLVG